MIFIACWSFTEWFSRSYRFRLVSLSCDPNFTFSIDGHSMTIIEVDGVNHQPKTVNQIQIFAGATQPNRPLTNSYSWYILRRPALLVRSQGRPSHCKLLYVNPPLISAHHYLIE